ncbi:MAG: molybdate ABC transporter substrate-binding protein [Sphingomonas sp.]|jgi:molybdate transport system substrate-binding protein
MRILRIGWLSAALLLMGAASQTGAASPASVQKSAPITVFAAASLADALPAVARAYTARTGVQVRFSFASSAVIARQLAAGARAELFMTADIDWMDYAEARNLILHDSRTVLLRGRLALIGPADSKVALKIGPGFALAAALGKRGRLAVGDPDYVPAGRYARAALLSLNVWANIVDRTVRADNVRVALAYVARKEAPLGIVYETDALVEPRVRIIDIFPTTAHPPIVYPLAITSRASNGARGLYNFLQGPEAGAIFSRYGFMPLARAR